MLTTYSQCDAYIFIIILHCSLSVTKIWWKLDDEKATRVGEKLTIVKTKNEKDDECKDQDSVVHSTDALLVAYTQNSASATIDDLALSDTWRSAKKVVDETDNMVAKYVSNVHPFLCEMRKKSVHSFWLQHVANKRRESVAVPLPASNVQEFPEIKWTNFYDGKLDFKHVCFFFAS